MKRTSFAILIGLFCLFPALFSQVRSEFLLEKNWKFTREDSPEFINPTFNDSKWLSLIHISINGIILREKWMIYSPVVAFVLVIYMLMSLINHGPVTVLWYLYFGLSFVVMMIIPGHILNNKAKKQCLKN